MEFKNTIEFVRRLIILNNGEKKAKIDDPKTILIHSSIYSKVLEFFTRKDVEVLEHLGYYELTVGECTFDMEMLVIRSTKNGRNPLFLTNLIQKSHYTYFWEKKFTLFIESDRFDELERFIRYCDLKKHVISVKEGPGVNSLGYNIKIVTFDDTIDEDLIYNQYVSFLNGYRDGMLREYIQLFHCYFTHALPWHRPKMLDMYRRINEFLKNQRIFLGLQTFLTWMRELNYTREPHLDLISLCSLKLAFCDDRNVTEASANLEFEIDALIEQILRQHNQAYHKNGNFDIKQYAANKNSQLSTANPAVFNLIYKFQHIFHCTSLPAKRFLEDIYIYEFTRILMLIDETKDLKVLRSRPKTHYEVDSTYYNKMNTKLFCELLKCRNVRIIRLDTNYKWINEPCFTEFDALDSKVVRIKLVGTNEFNFIEDFIQFLKTIPISTTSKMELIIEEVTLKHYNIFKNLEVDNLAFRGLKITFTMMLELLECDLKDIYLEFEKCTIEDQTCTWSLLLNGFDRENVDVDIVEEENTWQYLFESIANHITNLKLNQFKFKCDLYILSVSVSDMQFMFDKFNMRLDVRDYNGEQINLFNLKNLKTMNESNDDYKDF